MPRGISRAKHPEAYANQPVTTLKVAKAAAPKKMAAKKQVHWRTKQKQAAAASGQTDITKLMHLTQYVGTLTAIKNANEIRDLLDEEIGDAVEIMSVMRKKIFGEAPSVIEERKEDALRANTQTVTPAQPQVTPQQPVFTPPQPIAEQAPAQH